MRSGFRLDDNFRMAATLIPADKQALRMVPGSRMKAALILAVLADLAQMIVFPLFVEGGASPIDDVVDLVVGGAMTWLLGWHWEFLPSFAAKLMPGVDLIPLWTLAVANVYRKSKADARTLKPQTASARVAG
jgi:hypothetical protein